MEAWQLSTLYTLSSLCIRTVARGGYAGFLAGSPNWVGRRALGEAPPQMGYERPKAACQIAGALQPLLQ